MGRAGLRDVLEGLRESLGGERIKVTVLRGNGRGVLEWFSWERI